jgi:hypothetical protein
MTRSISFGRCWKSSTGQPTRTSSARGLQRRSQELDAGVVEAILAQEFFAKARAELKRR